MASTPNAARASARLASRYASLRYTPRRTFRTSSAHLEAQNYVMPALSPTMAEGNIASWKIKEGDSFTAGDVILEIETDKATMDVEAQDDGILFKIMKGDGEKGVRVGERIAVLAEQGDDLESLEVPEEDRSKIQEKPAEGGEESSSQQQTEQKGQESQKQSSQPAEQETESRSTQQESSSSSSSTPSPTSSSSTSRPQKQSYPLFPAVEQLLHQNGYSASEADKITPTGPNGRLLKGDVLAYLGQITASYPAQEAERLEKQSHLDLSNITPAKPKPESTQKAETKSAPEAQKEEQVESETEIALPISLTAVLATQKRVHSALGIWLPLSTFIARATDLANAELPAARKRTPSSDDLFAAILSSTRRASTATAQKPQRGHFVPQIVGISTPPVAAPAVPVRKPDIIDLLAPRAVKKPIPKVVAAAVPAAVGISPDGNIFSVSVPPGQEERAGVFLERMKGVLEEEPGRLVL